MKKLQLKIGLDINLIKNIIIIIMLKNMNLKCKYNKNHGLM